MSYLDVTQVRALLYELPLHYPGADEWIGRRIAEVNADEALAVTSVTDFGQLTGICIGKAKPDGRFKISTLYVAAGFRDQGRGSKLLQVMLAHTGQAETYITASTALRTRLGPLLLRNGFWPTATVTDRYGVGRSEDVYMRTPR